MAGGFWRTPPRPHACPRISSTVTAKRPSGAARQPLDEPAPSLAACQRAAPAAGHVATAARPQIANERGNVAVSNLDPVDVEHGLREARGHHEIAQVVHVECRMDVDPVVDGRECGPNLLQRVRART